MGNLTAEEIIKITLGTIGILILIYLSVSLIGIFTFKTGQEQARSTLNELNEVITYLPEGSSMSRLVILTKGWAIYTENENELCACPAGEWSSLLYRMKWADDKDCDSKKICVDTTIPLSFWVQSHERGDTRGGLPSSKKGFVLIDDPAKAIKLLRTSEGIEIWTADSLFGMDLEKKYIDEEQHKEIIKANEEAITLANQVLPTTEKRIEAMIKISKLITTYPLTTKQQDSLKSIINQDLNLKDYDWQLDIAWKEGTDSSIITSEEFTTLAKKDSISSEKENSIGIVLLEGQGQNKKIDGKDYSSFYRITSL